jgi:hypothetical protein
MIKEIKHDPRAREIYEKGFCPSISLEIVEFSIKELYENESK